MNANPGKISAKRGMRRYKKKSVKPKNNTELTKKVNQLTKSVKRLNKENHDHIFDTNSGTTPVPIPLTGYFAALNIPAQGDDYYNREGNEIYMKNVAIRCQLIKNSAMTTSCPIRIGVIYDKQCNGTLPTLEELFEDDLIATISARDFNNRQRFQWMYDKLFILDADDPEQIVNFRFPVKKKTQFDASTSALGSIETGSLLFVAFVDSTVLGEELPDIRLYSRLLFSP